MHFIPFRLTLLAAALAAAAPTYAADTKAGIKAEEKADAPIQKVEVKGAADSYNPRRDDTATKIVVSHAEIVKYGDTNVLDVLKRVPGVTVTAGTGRGGEVRMRGLGAGYTQILVDGERAPAGFSMESLPPDSIERIEVMRAATAEFSTQSIAGTINIVLRKAMRNINRELKTRLAWSDTSKPAPGMNLQMSDKRGMLAWSLGVNVDTFNFEFASRQTSRTSDLAGQVTNFQLIENEGYGAFRAFSMAPRLTWTFANGDTLTSTSGLNFSTHRGESGYSADTVSGTPQVYPYIENGNENLTRSARSELNWVKKFGPRSKLDMKLAASVSAGRPGGERFGFAGQYGALLSHRTDHTRARDHGYTTSGKYSAPLGEAHSLMAGWEAGISARSSKRVVDERYPLAGTRTSVREEFDTEVERYAAFAQDEWKISEQWSVYGGLRWEGGATKVEGTGYTESTTRSGVWSPLFQTLYKIPNGKGDQLRLALTRTYKPANPSSLIPTRSYSLNNSQEAPDWMGNPQLKPEIALGIDTSYEHYWGEGAMVSASASVREIDGYTSFVTVLGADGRWVTTLANKGKAQTRGIELEAKFPLKAVLAAAPAVDLRASLSRNWSSVDSVEGPNNRLATQTPLSLSLGADYKSGRLTTGAGLTYTRDGTVKVANNEVQVGASQRSADVYALWKFDARTQVRIAAANLLGKDYSGQRYYYDKAGTIYRTHTSPSVVNFRLALEFKY